MTCRHARTELFLAVTVAAVLAALAAPPTRARAADAGFTLRPLADTVAANARRQWPFDFELHNPGPYGLSLDSLVLETTPLAGPQAGQSRRARLHLPLAPSEVTAGEDARYHIELLASRVASRFVFEFHAHARGAADVKLTAGVVAIAYDPAAEFPPTVASVSGRAVELTRLLPPAEDANGGGVLLLPDEAADPADAIETGIRLMGQGYAVVVTLPPGAGRSQGPADMAGPASLAGALAGLDTLARATGVDPARVAAWGSGTGGTLALLLAERRADVAAVIAQSAIVDPWATHRALPAASRAAFVAAAGRDSAAWRARSPLAGLAALKARVLVLHGEKDEVSPAASARALVAALATQASPAESAFEPAGGHVLAAMPAFRRGQAFLKKHLSAGP